MTNNQKTQLRQLAENAKKNSRLWQAAKKVYYKVVKETTKLDDHLVLFDSFFGNKYACNPRALYEQMLADPKYKDYHFIWAFSRPLTNPKSYKQNVKSFPKDPRTKLVLYGYRKYRRVLLKAKYYITNSVTPDYMQRLPEQVIVQTWHGTPLKRLGCDIHVEKGNDLQSLDEIHQRYISRAAIYDYFLSPSDFYTEKLTSAFALDKAGMEHIILQQGYPRNDFLFNHTEVDVARVRKKYNIPADKKVILYAPTFRDDHLLDRGMPSIPLDYEELRRELGDDYVILFRTHYLVWGEIDLKAMEGFLIDASGEADINDLYIVSDMLITDYSSVFFDFANLKRPILLFMFDLDRYAGEIRGFYFDIKELPFPIVKTQEEMTEAVRRLDAEFVCDEAYEAFNKKFNPLEDGHSGQRVLETVFGNNKK